MSDRALEGRTEPVDVGCESVFPREYACRVRVAGLAEPTAPLLKQGSVLPLPQRHSCCAIRRGGLESDDGTQPGTIADGFYGRRLNDP